MPHRQLILTISVLLALFSYLLVKPPFVYALTCSVSVSPVVLNKETTTNVFFSVTNEGPEVASSVRIGTNEMGYFQLQSGSSSGWSVTVSDNYATFSDSSLSPGQSSSFIVSIFAIGETSPISFDVDVGGAGCSGGTDISVESFFNIESLAVSAGSNSATLTWTTTDPSTSSVSYGTTGSYGSTAGNDNLVTSHSVGLSSLSASATYYYQVCSTNETGQQSCSGQNTFTTGAAGTTTTVTTVATTTTTTAVSVAKDTSTPSIKINTKFDDPFEAAPSVEGSASDPSRVVKVEYSTDGGKNWLSAEADNLGEKSTSFSFTPNVTEDGNYEVIVRVTDGAGNRGLSKTYTMIIDRLPPLVGGNIWSLGPIPILPQAGGIVTVVSGVDYKLTMSAVGGPTSVELLVDGSSYPMTKSPDSGLWSGIINFASSGTHTVKVKSVDGAENETIRELNTVNIVSGGKIISKQDARPVKDAEIKVFRQDELSKLWSLWDGASFGQVNPYITGESGEYSYYLPTGTYYLTIKSDGFERLITKIFEIKTPTAINSTFTLGKNQWFIFFETTEVTLSGLGSIKSGENNILLEKEAPVFLLPKTFSGDVSPLDLRGKNQMITFISSWLPGTSEQIAEIMSLEDKYKDRVSIITIQESLSKVAIFAKRGGYENLTIAADPDGTQVVPYGINALPVSYILDKKGIVKKVLNNVVTADDIIKYLDSF